MSDHALFARPARLSRPAGRSLTAGLALAALLVAAPALAALGHAREGAVSFHATGPAGLKIEGKTSDVAVREDAGKVHVIVPLANLDTGISLRNKHMREKYLEVGKYPNAELVVDRAALKFPADGQETSASAPGQMTIHGQTKPVTFTYKASRAGSAYQVSGAVHVNLKDHGIDVPSYAGVTVKPDVDVTLKMKVDD